MYKNFTVIVAILGTALLGCADWDNPAALSELNAETQFEIQAARVETFEEVEIHVGAVESGSAMGLQRAEMGIENETQGGSRVVEMEPHGDGYIARVMFYEPGEHHLHFRGIPDGHSMMAEVGDHEIEVHRRHQVIGPYWVELELDPAPVLEGETAHIHLFVYALQSDGTPGNPVSGLAPVAEIHDTNGAETALTVTEGEPGEYEAQYSFVGAGVYELHVEIEGQDGEFHIPVLTSTDDSDHRDGDDHGGNGHGH